MLLGTFMKYYVARSFFVLFTNNPPQLYTIVGKVHSILISTLHVLRFEATFSFFARREKS